MSAGKGGGRPRRRGHGGGHDAGMERWLLTYADMITLLMALFIVMWAISSVNVDKFSALSLSLKRAFHGNLVEGGAGVLEGGRQPLNPEGTPVEPLVAVAPEQGVAVVTPSAAADEAAREEAEALEKLSAQVQEYAKAAGLAGRLETSLDERGLVIHLFPDDLLFDTGKAVVKPGARELLRRLSALVLGPELASRPVRVEGNTDNVPISTAEFGSNWELSTARAAAVLEELLAAGVAPHRLAAVGYADQRPVDSNATASGRALNRRVDIVVLRSSSAGREERTEP